MNDQDASLDVWWVIPGVLCGMSMPFIHPDRHDANGATLDAFPDELPLLWQSNIRAIVCLLNMPGAAATYSSAGFSFHLLPLADGAAPTLDNFQKFVAFVDEQRAVDRPVAVHCEAGIGRTGTLLAGYLIASGETTDLAIARIRSLRRGAIETACQVRFLHELNVAEERDV